MNKTKKENSVITPKATDDALCNLPFDYAIQTMSLLEEWKTQGKIEKSYSKNYIVKVKTGKSFNENILKAIVEIGTKHKELKEQFGVENKSVKI